MIFAISKRTNRKENCIIKDRTKPEIQKVESQMMIPSSTDTSEIWESMDGHPTLVFKPVYKSFKFKTYETMEGLKVEDNNSLKDNNEFIANPKRKDPEAVQSLQTDEKWKAAMDYDLPELVAFLQDSGYEFVKDICIDSEVPSQNKCSEENCDLDLNNVFCMISSDAKSSSESTVESEDSSVSSDSTVSKHIAEHECKEDVSNQSGLENLTIEDGEYFGETDDSSSDHSTKKTIYETLVRTRQDPTKEVLSDSVALSSSEAIDDNRRSKNSLETALENAKRIEVLPPSVECHSQNSSEDGMSDSLTRPNKSQHCSKNARREVFPQSDSSEDWMSVRGSSQSQQHHRENARRVVWPLSEECHTQDSSEDGMSDNSVTESNQSQQHQRGESSSSVSGPIAMHSGAVPSFGSFSFRSNSSATSSRSFTFPILSAEWIGSPVRMVEGDRTQLRRQRRWGIRFLCCNF